MPPVLVHASYFVSFPLLNKSIPTLTPFPLFFIMKNKGWTRIVTEPWNFLLPVQFVLGIQTNSQDSNLTNANCEPICWSYLGSCFHTHFSSTPLFTNSRKNPGVSLRGIGSEDLTVSTMPLFFFCLIYLFLCTVSHLCSPLLPPLLSSHQSPLPRSLHAV